jgi:hypothetical protein
MTIPCFAVTTADGDVSRAAGDGDTAMISI